MERYLSPSHATESEFYLPRSEKRSFLTSTPTYSYYGNRDHSIRSVIPQCHLQRPSTEIHSYRLQSQSCRPILIHDQSEHSFEHQPNLRNSFSSHGGWRNWQQYEPCTKTCSVDLCQDSFHCNQLPRNNAPRNGFHSSLPRQQSATGIMRVIHENMEDKVMSTSDENESFSEASNIYPLCSNENENGSLKGNCGSEVTSAPEAQTLYSWIIKVLPDNSGPCVEGKLKEDDDTYWHSSLIAERLESHLVVTVSGKVYRLMGDMEVEDAHSGGFDDQTISEFLCGFPVHWREVMDTFFSGGSSKSNMKLSHNDVEVDGDVDDNVSLLDETLKPSEETHNLEEEKLKSNEVVKTTKKKEKLKKEIPKKPVTKVRTVKAKEKVSQVKEQSSIKKVEHAKKKQKKDVKTSVPSGNVIEVCTPESKVIKLDSVQTTRSGRAVKPVLAWYAGQSVSIDPETNSYVLRHRTQFAETVMKDMTDFCKSRSTFLRKTVSLNSSSISKTSREHHKNKTSDRNGSEKKVGSKFNKINNRSGTSDSESSVNNSRQRKKASGSSVGERKIDKSTSDNEQRSGSDQSSKSRRSSSGKTRQSKNGADKYGSDDENRIGSDQSLKSRRSSSGKTGQSKNGADKYGFDDENGTGSDQSSKSRRSSSGKPRQTKDRAKNTSKSKSPKQTVSLKDGKPKKGSKAGEKWREEESQNKEQGEKLRNVQNKQGGYESKQRATKTEGKENQLKENKEQTVWRKEEVTRLNLIIKNLHQCDPEFWSKVVNHVQTKTVEECQEYFYKEMPSKKNGKGGRPPKPKETAEQQISLTAKRGTLKRKQQLRELVDHSNKVYQEDLFDGTPYRHHSKMPRLSDDREDDVFAELSKRNPHMMNKVFTPMTRINVDPISTKKTPSSGLTGVDSQINRKDADQYIHKMNIQRRKLVNKTKPKTAKNSAKDKIPVPNKKLFSKSDDLQSLFMENCGSDSNHDNSEDESDYYFSEEEEN
ncbi:mis18-binding protein 1-like [Saccostrea echinata]|uniref:mis18-binding protein 1-like n=1 Tax=Saccostrea echinata TaxID=191078 RepID=UPI002A821623|nr:mis18-binding protein 1-like [Saccostrea echinata]